MIKLQKLSVGISSFERIREDDYLYVDKTRHIFRMADEGIFYFMSRPRRFGKSLTVSTLLCLFQGRKELFEGLWINDNTDWDWKEHPVIVIDFNEIPHQTPETLTRSIWLSMDQTAQKYGISLNTDFIETRFRELVVALENQYKTQVVVLVDEYDKPIIDHLGKGKESIEIAFQNRDVLKGFFGVLKGASVSPCLKFVFITGVSKFSRVSIFSELNNLEDITMSEPYAAILGYTQDELEIYFKPYIRQLSEKTGDSEEEVSVKLEQHYNGYRFSKCNIRVYNPFSIMSALKQKDFRNYWFETGTPTFLVNILKEKNYPVAKIENLRLDEQIFSVYDIENLKPEALLFQTGYITIKDVEDSVYTFDYPNEEVKLSFLKFLLFSYIPGNGSDLSLFLKLSGHLRAENLDAFFETITAIFASIPYTLESKRDEAYFHTAFFLIVSASGVNARSEVLTCAGRIDLVMEFSDKVFIIEFKCNQNAEAAIRQIRERGYADRYSQSGKKIFLIGINFDTEKRNVAEWKVCSEIKPSGKSGLNEQNMECP